MLYVNVEFYEQKVVYEYDILLSYTKCNFIGYLSCVLPVQALGMVVACDGAGLVK